MSKKAKITNEFANLEIGDCGIKILNLIPYVLYQNDNGSNESVNLSDDINNYQYIEIIYKNESYRYNSVKIPCGQLYATLITHYTADWGTQIHISDAYISGNTIKLLDGRFINCILSDGNLSYGSQTTIRIIKVIGYK